MATFTLIFDSLTVLELLQEIVLELPQEIVLELPQDMIIVQSRTLKNNLMSNCFCYYYNTFNVTPPTEDLVNVKLSHKMSPDKSLVLKHNGCGYV